MDEFTCYTHTVSPSVMSHVSSMSSKDSAVGMVGARQLKQAAFLQQVQQVAEEERANHLRW